MPHYVLTWEIDIDADSPAAAARHALQIQRDPNSIATVFDVIQDDCCERVRVDLSADPVTVTPL